MSRITLVLLLMALSACAPQASRVFVDKSDRVMVLFDTKNKEISRYPIALGTAPEGAKTEMGDGKTPEGRYTIDWRNPRSLYYKSLHISYPNDFDLAQAQMRNVQPGHSIMIHGMGDQRDAWHRTGDWTQGCIAVSNRDMNEIWADVPNGTPILIVP